VLAGVTHPTDPFLGIARLGIKTGQYPFCGSEGIHEEAAQEALPIGTRGLVKCNADPACLPPHDVTVVIAVLDVDNKIERTGNSDLAFDLKIRTANRHIADQAVDPGAVERDCSGLYDFLALGAAIVVHQNPLCQSVQI
jgi:hypothetical protein